MDNRTILEFFRPLYDDLRPEEMFPIKRPLLSHYTTIQVFEQILKNNEIWFSNPLFMNDFEEVRFGIAQGHALVINNPKIEKACGNPKRATLFQAQFQLCFDRFAEQHVLNTYVFCLCDHKPDDNDGLLSMWRGYGANGNGVAIVFDSAKINPTEGSPLIFGKVEYGTTEARREWINKLISTFADILIGVNLSDEQLYLAAHSLFERIKLFALFTKHRGFKEEDEWRIVYMPDRDAGNKLHQMFGYAIDSRGIEQKLKFKILPVEGITVEDLSLTKIVDRIILGPSVSSPLVSAAVLRMLDILKHPDLKPKLVGSQIPFRAIK